MKFLIEVLPYSIPLIYFGISFLILCYLEKHFNHENDIKNMTSPGFILVAILWLPLLILISLSMLIEKTFNEGEDE